MNVKIDTKEKFQVFTPEEPILTVNMTDELVKLLLSCLKKEIKNVVLNMKAVKELDEKSAQQLLNCQQEFYDQQNSFVICELTTEVENFLEKIEILDIMNYTPTESEAWDIIQMEEIEREFFEDE